MTLPSLLLLLLTLSVVCALDLHPDRRLTHNTYHLGRHRHPHRRNDWVEGYLFVQHHRLARISRVLASLPSGALVRKRSAGAAADEPLCGSPIADGAAWRTSRGYVIAGRNRLGLSADFLVQTLAEAMATWRCALRRANVSDAVLGPLLDVDMQRSASDFDLTTPSGENLVTFGCLRDLGGGGGALAATSVFGRLTGPLERRELTSFKMVLNQCDYRFGNASEQLHVIDTLGTVIHEIGHALGLNDANLAACINATMYETSEEDDTRHRRIDAADVDGVASLYARARSQLSYNNDKF